MKKFLLNNFLGVMGSFMLVWVASAIAMDSYLHTNLEKIFVFILPLIGIIAFYCWGIYHKQLKRD